MILVTMSNKKTYEIDETLKDFLALITRTSYYYVGEGLAINVHQIVSIESSKKKV
jgi:hypothetical protein